MAIMGETKYRSNVRHLTLRYDSQKWTALYSSTDLESPKAMNFTSTRRKNQET